MIHPPHSRVALQADLFEGTAGTLPATKHPGRRGQRGSALSGPGVRRSGPAAHRQLRRCRAVRRLRRQGGEKVSSRARQRASAVIRSGRATASSPHARDAWSTQPTAQASSWTPSAPLQHSAARQLRRRRQHQPRGLHRFSPHWGPAWPVRPRLHTCHQCHLLRTGPVASMLLMAAALSAARSWSLGGAAGSPEEGQQAQVPATGGRLLGTATPTPPPARERAEHPDLHCQRLDRNTAAVRA
jgi:hypothetical protein